MCGARNRAHYLKDFVLLENSIRFMIFPPYVDLRDQLRVDKAFLEEKGYEDVAQMTLPKNLTKMAYKRLARMVGVIRRAAQKVGGKAFSFDEYLAAQFLMLYGLMKFPEYHKPAALRALGMIGGRVAKTKYAD